MRKAHVYCQGVLAGEISRDDGGVYHFAYAPEYLGNPERPPVSLTLPKQKVAFDSSRLFPFFFGLLAEGEDKVLQCRILKIDENDHFTRLLRTCETETIGAISVKEIPIE